MHLKQSKQTHCFKFERWKSRIYLSQIFFTVSQSSCRAILGLVVVRLPLGAVVVGLLAAMPRYCEVSVAATRRAVAA